MIYAVLTLAAIACILLGAVATLALDILAERRDLERRWHRDKLIATLGEVTDKLERLAA